MSTVVRRRWPLLVGVATISLSLVLAISAGQATSGGDPYSTPDVVDSNPDPDVVETTLVAREASVDLGGGVMAMAQTFNGAIPGPTFHLKVGDTVVVHFENQLDMPTGIHWHGIELANGMDGTPFTQNQVPPGGSFLYRFKVTRPGIYWYHPHNHASTNQVFKGMYGMIMVSDPSDAALRAAGTLPSEAQTRSIVLSDTTVCKEPGSNDTATYDPSLPHVSGQPLQAQGSPTPRDLCETQAVDEHGMPRGPFAAGEIPNVQTPPGSDPMNEGQTVLTNGRNVGGRGGSPGAPGALSDGASTLGVRAGQGLRLQLVNAATERYMRLRLTTSSGALVPLVRVGGEGGLLDRAVVEGGITPEGFDTRYEQGEIVLPPGSRADVVAAIPSTATGTLTLWTEDYRRIGENYTNVPTVPVMHLTVTGTPVAPPYTITAGTPLRAATLDPVPQLGAPTGTLLNPAAFPQAKLGLASQTIQFQSSGSDFVIDGTAGTHDHMGPYSEAPHLGSTRYAKEGDVLQLTVRNATSMRHPFHLHGFSFQPVSLTSSSGPAYNWPYAEFRDNVDIPGGYTLTYRVRLDPRPLPDGATPGGAKGRWMFHCHIFHHSENGMLSELVVGSQDGNERPDVDVGQVSVTVTQGESATLTGTYDDRDGDPVTLSASEGSVTKDGAGHWTWASPTTGTPGTHFAYVTATDSRGLKAQTPFVVTVLAAGGGGSGGSGGGSGGSGGGSGGSGGSSGAGTAELTALVDRPERLTRKAITVGCRLSRGSIRSCDAAVYAAGRRVGTGSTTLTRSGSASALVRVVLDRGTRRRVARSLAGRRVQVRLTARSFGSSSPLAARADTVVIPPRISVVSRSAAFARGRSALTRRGRAFLRSVAKAVPRARRITCVAYPESAGGRGLARARAAAACKVFTRAGVMAKLERVGAGRPPRSARGEAAGAASRRLKITVMR